MNDSISRHDVYAWLCNLGHSKLANCIMDENRFPSIDVPDIYVGNMISRQDAIDYLTIKANRIGAYGYISTKEIYDYLSVLPSVEPKHKNGKWILDEDPHDGDCRCSVCLMAIDQMHERNHGLLNALTGEKWWTFYKYCPNCGARMER